MLLDTLAPADRFSLAAGSHNASPRGHPVAWPDQSEAAWLVDWIHLLRAIGEELNEDCPLPADVLAEALGDPRRFSDGFQNAFGTEESMRLILGPLTTFAGAAQQVVLGLLGDPRLTLDQQLLDDAWLAVETGRRLIAQVLDSLRAGSTADD